MFWRDLTYHYLPHILAILLLAYIAYLGYSMFKEPSMATGLRVLLAAALIVAALMYPMIYDPIREVSPEAFSPEWKEYVIMEANLTITQLENLRCYEQCPSELIITEDSITTTQRSTFGLLIINQTTYITADDPMRAYINLTQQ